MTPVLPRGVRIRWDRVRTTYVLLGPERAILLDDIAHAILSRVDGATPVAAICADLAETFEAPLDAVTGDVDAFLTDLADKRLLDFRHD